MESLNGQNSYTVTFAKDRTSPVHGFWSLTFITKGVLPPEVLGGLITRSNGHSSPSSVPIARFVLSAGVLSSSRFAVPQLSRRCFVAAEWLAHGSA
jgi:hypothetical protein